MSQTLTEISGISVEQFMNQDWQVKPVLFRAAFPQLEPVCDIDTVFELASDEDIESRLIEKVEDEWLLSNGPFEELPDLNRRNWTVLIQGLDHHLPEAEELLQQFRFLPDARLDDIMLSLASDGGGVGPHYDSYDVFLIQMHGKRRWRIGPLNNKRLLEDCPLRILADFDPTEEYILEPGDMLYLPPNYGHDGEAIGVCSTISVGFRAQSQAEVLSTLLRDIADKIEADENLKAALFSDPKRGLTKDPTEIPSDLIQFSKQLLLNLSPSEQDIAKSLGISLTEPKPLVYFDRDCDEMSSDEILDVLAERGIAVGMKTKILFANTQCFINGEALDINDTECLQWLKRLSVERELEPNVATEALKNESFAFYAIGFAKAGWINTVL